MHETFIVSDVQCDHNNSQKSLIFFRSEPEHNVKIDCKPNIILCVVLIMLRRENKKNIK